MKNLVEECKDGYRYSALDIEIKSKEYRVEEENQYGRNRRAKIGRGDQRKKKFGRRNLDQGNKRLLKKIVGREIKLIIERRRKKNLKEEDMRKNRSPRKRKKNEEK